MISKLLPPLALLASTSGIAFTASPPPPDVVARIDDYAQPFVKAEHLSGTLLVAFGDEVIYERSWGLADRDSDRAFDSTTMSCIASVTKPTTVILASQLIDGGTISLRDPVSKWLSDFPAGDRIQFQHLLFHRSGIPHRVTTADQENTPYAPADVVQLARTRELEFEPGSQRSYSSGGFSVMVCAMEIASGQTYEQLLQDVILQPLKLSHTVHPGPGVNLKDAATSYTWAVDGRKPAPKKHLSFLVGAGALYSTPRDLRAISRALIDGKFGERAQRTLLRFGSLRWNGITNGYRAFLDYDAKTDLTVVFVSNQMVGANDRIRRDVPKILAGEEVETSSVPNPEFVDLPQTLLDRYVGMYEIAGAPMAIETREGALFANEWILLPVSETSFFSPQDYATVRIVGQREVPEALDWDGMQCPRIGPIVD